MRSSSVLANWGVDLWFCLLYDTVVLSEFVPFPRTFPGNYCGTGLNAFLLIFMQLEETTHNLTIGGQFADSDRFRKFQQAKHHEAVLFQSCWLKPMDWNWCQKDAPAKTNFAHFNKYLNRDRGIVINYSPLSLTFFEFPIIAQINLMITVSTIEYILYIYFKFHIQ